MSKADLAKKPAEVAAMFDAVAPTYDVTNTWLSAGQDHLWRRAALKAVAPKAVAKKATAKAPLKAVKKAVAALGYKR